MTEKNQYIAKLIGKYLDNSLDAAEAQQLERLRTERFGEVQGYLTGRPMPASDVHAFIQSNNGTGLAMPAAHNRLPV